VFGEAIVMGWTGMARERNRAMEEAYMQTSGIYKDVLGHAAPASVKAVTHGVQKIDGMGSNTKRRKKESD